MRADLVHAADGSPAHTVILKPNEHDRLATAHLTVQAQGFNDAQRTAHDLVAPLLSRWSFEHDVAVDITAVELLEVATGSRRWNVKLLGMVKPAAALAGPSTPALRGLLAAYREGVSSLTVFYQVLAFFRIYESVKKLRAMRRSSMRGLAAKERLPADERLLSDEWTRDSFRPYLGKKFTAVIDDLRDVLRHAIAHLDPEGDSVVADRYDDLARCEQVVPVLRYIARQMLTNELAMAACEASPGETGTDAADS